jgi:peroxiredoxin
VFCLSELQGLQTRFAELEKQGVELIAVSSSSPEQHRRIAEKLGLRFPLLSDSDGAAQRALGLEDADAFAPPGSARPIARPGVFILDRSGSVRARFLTDNWRVRVRPEWVLAELAKLE